MRIIFSILVHEKIEVVINQINNFLKYNPNSLIILHVSKRFRKAIGNNIINIENIKDVIINPISIDTGIADNTQLLAHIQNLRFAIENNISFDYISFHASNDMFIRNGLDLYIINYDAGTNNFSIYDTPWWEQAKASQFDLCLQKIISHKKTNQIIGSQIEGLFMNKSIAIQVLNTCNRYGIYPPSSKIDILKYKLIKSNCSKYIIKKFFPGLFYAKEEIYFSTIIRFYTDNIGKPYVFINWKKNLNIDKEDISAIISNDYSYLSKKAETLFNEKNMFFAVKRVNRNLQDPIRIFINNNC